MSLSTSNDARVQPQDPATTPTHCQLATLSTTTVMNINDDSVSESLSASPSINITHAKGDGTTEAAATTRASSSSSALHVGYVGAASVTPSATRGNRRVRDPSSPRRSTFSLSPPSHILSTARCSSTDRIEERTRDVSVKRRTGSKSQARCEERAGTTTATPTRGLESGHGTAITCGSSRMNVNNRNMLDSMVVSLGSGRASATTTLPEKRREPLKKKAKLVARTMGMLPQRERGNVTATTIRKGDIGGSTSHMVSSGRGSRSNINTTTDINPNSILTHAVKTPVSPPPAPPGIVSTCGGRRSTSSNGSFTTSSRATAPPSARTSAVVEAFLLGVQNCLSKQELLFQELSMRLARVDAMKADTVACSASNQQLQSRVWSSSPTNATNSDERDVTSTQYPVGTPAESPLGPASICDLDGNRPTTSPSSVHNLHRPVSANAQSTSPDMELMSSFDTQAQTLPSLHTPSCSVVIMNPTLERKLTANPPASFLQSTDQASPLTITTIATSATTPASTASSLASPNYLRFDNIEVTASTSATPSTISEQLGALSSSASATPPSPAQLWSTVRQERRKTAAPNGQTPVGSTTIALSPSPSFHTKAPHNSSTSFDNYTPLACFVLNGGSSQHGDDGTDQNNNNNRNVNDNDKRGNENSGASRVARTSVVPARRSSAVQVGGSAVLSRHALAEELQQTPLSVNTAGGAASATSIASTSGIGAGGRYTPNYVDGTTLPSSFNPPAQPILTNNLRIHNAVLVAADLPGTCGVSPLPTAPGNMSLRLTTMSNGMSLLTSMDSVTLSPLSRPMSTWGGSPLTHSVHRSSSPAQQQQQQPSTQQLQFGGGTLNNSFNTASGTPVSTRSPSGPAVGRGGSGSSPRPRSIGNVNTGIAGFSPHSPILSNFISPPSAAVISSSESPLVSDAYSNVRPPQLLANVISSPSSVRSSRNTTTVTGGSGNNSINVTGSGGCDGGGSGIPLLPHMCRLAGDVLSPLSASSSSPSSTPTTMSHRASLVLNRNVTKAAPGSLYRCSNSSFASANSLDDETRSSLSAQTAQQSKSSHRTSRAGYTAPTLLSFPDRDEDNDHGNCNHHNHGGGTGENEEEENAESNFVWVRGSIPASAKAPTHRQLTLSTSPSVERGSREGREMQSDQQQHEQFSAFRDNEGFAEEKEDDSRDPKKGVVGSGDLLYTAEEGEDNTVGSDVSEDTEEQSRTQEIVEKTLNSTSVSANATTTFNPFAIPPPPSSLSELHAYQQRRRSSAAPVPTMRRPPMAPSRPSNFIDHNCLTTLNEPPSIERDLTGVTATATAATGIAAAGNSRERAAQLEQWLPFERQHEQLHLPACWRDSEVIVVDHVEEVDRERDEEAEAQLRLLEAELMSGWQATPSESEKEDSQTRDEEEEVMARRRWMRIGGYRHSYPGNLSLLNDRDRMLCGRSDAACNADNATWQHSDNDHNNDEGDIGDDGDDCEWDDEAEAGETYQKRLAQYGRMMLLLRRRSLHASRHRSIQSTTNNPNNNDGNNNGDGSVSGGGGEGGSSAARWTIPGGHAGGHRRRPERTGESDEGRDRATFAISQTGANPEYISSSEARPATSSTSLVARESHRLFRRGHSAPVVLSNNNSSSGSADWRRLRARFDELVTIQQRVRAAGDEGSIITSSGAVANVLPSSSTVVESGATNEGSTKQPFLEGEGVAPSSHEPLRSRRHRSLSCDSRVAPKPVSMTVHEANDGVERHEAAAPLQTDASNNETSSSGICEENAPSSFMAERVEKSRQRTLVYQADESVEGRAMSSPLERADLPQDTADHFPMQADDNTDAAFQKNDTDISVMDAERPHSAPPAGQTRTGNATNTSVDVPKACQLPSVVDSCTTPERQHRSGVTAIHKDPPAYLANPVSTLTVDANHATGPPTSLSTPMSASTTTPATTAAANMAATLTLTLDPAQLKTVEYSHYSADKCTDKEEDEERTEEIESFPSADESEGDTSAGKKDASAIGNEVCAPVLARPPWTPRLRFTHTPRGTTRPNALRRMRRVVIMHSAASEQKAKENMTAENPERYEATGDEAADATAKKAKKKSASLLSFSAAATKPTKPDARERQQAKKTRGTSGSGSNRKKANAKMARSRSAPGSASKSADTELPAVTAAVDDRVANMENRRASLGFKAVTPSKAAAWAAAAEQENDVVVSLSANRLAHHANTLDGGEIVEPLPLGATTLITATATASHIPLTSLSSISAPTITTTTVPTAAMFPPDEQKNVAGAVRGNNAAASSPKAARKVKKSPTNASATTTVRRKSMGADADIRSNVSLRKEKQRDKDDGADPYRSTEREGRRTADSDIGGNGENDSGKNHKNSSVGVTGADAVSTAPSRALLRRLAQRKERTRAMEERLRLSSGNFIAVSAALATSSSYALEGEDGSGFDSSALTPMRSVLKSQPSPHGESTPQHVVLAAQTPGREPPLSRATEYSTTIAATNTATTPITDPLTVQEEPNSASGLVNSGFSAGSHDSDQRHVSVVEPLDGPSVTFASTSNNHEQHPRHHFPFLMPGQHPTTPGGTGSGRLNMRRRLVDGRARPTTTKQNLSSSLTSTTGTSTAASAAMGQKRTQSTGRSSSMSPTAAAAAGSSASTTNAAAASAGGVSSSSSCSATHTYKQWDT